MRDSARSLPRWMVPTVAAWLAGCLACGVAWADTIYLKNGRQMTGTIIQQTPTHVTVDVGAGTVTFSRREVASIERGGPTTLEAETPGGAPRSETNRPASPADSPETTSRARRGARRGQGAVDAERLIRVADAILPDVSRLRGLKATGPIKKQLADKDTIRRILEATIARQYPDETLNHKTKALVKLGLLPASVDLREMFVELYTHQVSGMYDQHSQTLYLADWIPAQIQAPVIAHELVHALQDQHFDLRAYLEAVRGDSEAQLARQAIVEGEALAIQLDYELRLQGISFTDLGDLANQSPFLIALMNHLQPGKTAIPVYLQELMLFPYTHGLGFLQAVRRHHPWSWVAHLYSEPPQSSEQIMHPERYLTTLDVPTPVQIADVTGILGPTWERIDEDVLGEFSLRFLVRTYVDAKTGVRAADGWDGDRYQLYEEADTKQLLLLVVSVWDSAEDAREFLEAYRQVVPKKYPYARAVASRTDHWWAHSGDIRLVQRGATILIIEGAQRPWLDELTAVLLGESQEE